MKVKELIDELSKFDSDFEIEFEFEEYNADGGDMAIRARRTHEVSLWQREQRGTYF